MKKEIMAELKESINVKNKVLKDLVPAIEKAAKKIMAAYKQGKKVLLFGNGGSAADAQHLAAELVVRFKKDRPPLAALALTTNTSILTAAGNDYGFNIIFKRQVEALGSKGDVAIGISTSGRSTNVLKGLEAAKEKGLFTIGLLGQGGGEIAKRVDLPIIVPSDNTPRIQECHITIGHILCNLIEKELFA